VATDRRGWRPGPRIYNLFPLLAGSMTRWEAHLERARRLGFDWIFVNAFATSGHSGSLYSIKDHQAIDPRFVDPAAGPSPSQLEAVVRAADRLDLRLMTDLVINHTAFDSPLVQEHPDWYRRGDDGRPVHPGALDGDRWVTWGDLAEVDNAGSPDRENLWRYWLALAERLAAAGFSGFRADAAYKVPGELWRFLLSRLKAARPDTMFFAESLGCPIEDTVRLARAGFDFVFNSSKWWDFAEPWCLEQYRQSAPLAPSVSFPESHDTARLAMELDGVRQAVEMRYAFAALFSTGVMMPIGFEFGFRRRLDVVKTRPEDWETPQWDLGNFIARINALKASYRVFNEDGPIEVIDLGNPNVFAFVKAATDGSERALVALNKDPRSEQSFELHWVAELARTTTIADVSPSGPLDRTADYRRGRLPPSGVAVLYARSGETTTE
jgi:starch synthase (maltosyl-transferring)